MAVISWNHQAGLLRAFCLSDKKVFFSWRNGHIITVDDSLRVHSEPEPIMNRFLYSVYIAGMALIIFAVTVYLAWYGFDFYRTPIEERFYHPQYKWFQPAGIFGHGLGVIGTLLILFGVVIYIAAKRYNFLIKYIRLKYIPEFHIFLCILVLCQE